MCNILFLSRIRCFHLWKHRFILFLNSSMQKPIEIILLPPAEKFLDALEDKARMKLMHAMRKTQARIFGSWFQKLTGTDDIYEFRIKYEGKFYRLFAFWDTRGAHQTLIVGTHGLLKKSNRTPRSEIMKAVEIKRKYFTGHF